MTGPDSGAAPPTADCLSVAEVCGEDLWQPVNQIISEATANHDNRRQNRRDE